jgi:hypothetical protein
MSVDEGDPPVYLARSSEPVGERGIEHRGTTMSNGERDGTIHRWLTILSNFAVIAGLVFVALEIRVNTTAVHSATVQDLTSLSAQALAELAADSALAHLRLRGDADPAALSELESYQYFSYYRGYWIRFQNAYFQKRLGVLDGAAWGMYARIICTDIKSPGVRATWSRHSPVLDPGFVAIVEACPGY